MLNGVVWVPARPHSCTLSRPWWTCWTISVFHTVYPSDQDQGRDRPAYRLLAPHLIVIQHAFPAPSLCGLARHEVIGIANNLPTIAGSRASSKMAVMRSLRRNNVSDDNMEDMSG